jgi:hypothetical protein
MEGHDNRGLPLEKADETAVAAMGMEKVIASVPEMPPEPPGALKIASDPSAFNQKKVNIHPLPPDRLHLLGDKCLVNLEDKSTGPDIRTADDQDIEFSGLFE